MVTFEGVLSEKCKKFIIKNVCVIFALTGTIAQTIFMICVGAFGHVNGIKFLVDFSIHFGLVMLLVTPTFIFFAMSMKQTQKEYIPTKIYVNTVEETIVIQLENCQKKHAIDAVNEIVDYGEWYQIKFRAGDWDISAVIQKDLITQGTIEEFEKIFYDKIKVLND